MRHWKTKPVQGNPLVGMVVATYRQAHCLRALCASIQAQTYPRFVVYVYHDGPADDSIRAFFPAGDARFKVIETEARADQFGHNLRARGFDELYTAEKPDFMMSTNGDGYYVPVFFESCIHALQTTQGAQIAHTDMVLSHERNGRCWQPLITAPKRGSMDIGCWVARAALVHSTPWTDFSFAGDWAFFHEMLRSAGPKGTVRVPSTLFVHN